MSLNCPKQINSKPAFCGFRCCCTFLSISFRIISHLELATKNMGSTLVEVMACRLLKLNHCTNAEIWSMISLAVNFNSIETQKLPLNRGFRKLCLEGVGHLVESLVLWYFYDILGIQHIMMTSSNGNIFCVTGPLCEEFTGHRRIPLTKASDAELWYFLWSAVE